MKRYFILLLALIISVSLFSCSNKDGQDIVETDPIPETTDENSDTSYETEEYVPSEDEDNSMFLYPEDPAKYVVDYMREMATREWTPDVSFHLYGKYQAWKFDLNYKVGETYYGPPFLVDSRGTLQEFDGSLINGKYVGGTTLNNCIGSACYDAVFVSLIQVCPSISFKSTEDMLPRNNTGLEAVGEYNWKVSKSDTPTILFENSMQTMGRSYAELRAGDVVLKHVVVQDAGHARIVAKDAHVVYGENNTIDMGKSYITTLEQTNLWDAESSVNTTWWVDRKYTFADLYSTNFVPLRPVDYTKKLSPAYIKTDDLIKEDEIPNAKKLRGEISSNQYITEVEITVENSDGKVIYEHKEYPTSKKFDLSSIRYSPKLYNYKNGTYKFTIKASLATGTKTLAEYTFENQR